MKTRFIIFLISFLCASFGAYTQGIIDYSQTMPQFPGGEAAMREFISKRLIYPQSALRDSVQGQVRLRFIIRASGEVSDVSVTNGLTPDCDSIAVGIIKAMPRWQPSVENGKPVACYYSWMIEFTHPAPKENIPYTTSEVMPQFPGGEVAMQLFIAKNMNFPASTRELGLQGRTTIRFVVNVDGKIVDINVVKEIDKVFTDEWVRLVKSMPDWTPGQMNGENVNCYFTLPFLTPRLAY